MDECQLDGFLKTQDKNATEEIQESLRIYGTDVLTTKFPHVIDGLKNITRRIIWFSQFDQDYIGMVKFIGNIVDAHVSGDSSIEEAIIRLAQNFQVGHPLISIEGNLGKYYNPSDAAHPRYLTAKLSEFSRDMFFKGMHPRTIPMIPMKDFAGMEPAYLIPKLPMALILGNLTVGFGYKSYTPMLDFSDVCRLVQIFAEFYSKGGIGIPKTSYTSKWIIPTFPVKNLIKNRDDLISNYNQKNYAYPLEMEGWLMLTGDTITLSAVPYGVDFHTSTSNFLKVLMEDKKHWLHNELAGISNFSAQEAEFVITIKRGRNPFAVLDKIKSMLHFNKKWTPIYTYIKDNRVFPMNPLIVTEMWYRERAAAIASGLKYKQTDLIIKRMNIEAMLKIAEHKDKVIDIIRNSEDEEDAIDQIYKNFKDLTWRQARLIAGQKLTVLTKCSRRQLEADLEQTNADLEDTLASFGKVHEIIASDAQVLQKKYSPTLKTSFSNDFIGYVKFGDWGIIQFFTEDEMINILTTKNWPSDLLKTIHRYDPKTTTRWITRGVNTSQLLSNSKEIFCQDFIVHPIKRLPYTVGVSDGYMCIVDKPVDGNYPGTELFPVTSRFLAVHRNGKITEEDVKDYTLRKNVCQGIKSDIIAAVPNTNDKYLIFYMCSSAPNTLRIARITPETKLVVVPTGRIAILAIVKDTTDKVYLNIPSDCIKALSMQYLIAENVSQLCKKSPECVNLSKIPKSHRDTTLKTLSRWNTK